MTFPVVPKDPTGIPFSSLYVPGVGFIALQGVTPTSDGSGNQSALVSAALYGKVTNPGDTPLLLDSSGRAIVNINTSPASTTGTLTSVGSTTSASTQLLPANSSRRGMMLYNESTAILYLGFSATVTTTSYTVQVPANSFFEMPTTPVYTGVIAGVWSVANGNARLTELT